MWNYLWKRAEVAALLPWFGRLGTAALVWQVLCRALFWQVRCRSLGLIGESLLPKFDWYCILLDDLRKLLRSGGDRAREELGDVVAAKELPVVLGVVLRQFEGLGEMALAVEVGDEGAGEVAIDAPAGEDDPTLVAGPAMPTLDFGGVDF